MSNRFTGLELLSTAVIFVNEKLEIEYLNFSAENLLSTSKKNVFNIKFEELFKNNKEFLDLFKLVQDRNNAITHHEIEFVTHEKKSYELTVTISPLNQKNFYGHIVEFFDFKERKRLSREEKISDQSMYTKELIRNLAHEIKNPLGALRGAAQLLDLELNSEYQKEYTSVIISEADRLKRLMDNLLSPHRIPKTETFNIHEAIEKVRSLILIEFAEKLNISRNYDISLPPVFGDKEQIIQALLNIARNAAQSFKKKGIIEFKTRIVRKKRIQKKIYSLAVLTEINDNGPGIPEKIKDKIFYPLVSSRQDGNGIGLALTQNFVNQNLGTIEFNSEIGSTSFKVYLPIIYDTTKNKNTLEHI